MITSKQLEKYYLRGTIVDFMLTHGQIQIVSWYLQNFTFPFNRRFDLFQIAVDSGHEKLANMILDFILPFFWNLTFIPVPVPVALRQVMINKGMMDLFEKTLFLTSSVFTIPYFLTEWMGYVHSAIRSNRSKIADFLISITGVWKIRKDSTISVIAAMNNVVRYAIEKKNFDIFELLVDPKSRKYDFATLKKYINRFFLVGVAKKQARFHHSKDESVWTGSYMRLMITTALNHGSHRILEWILKNKTESRDFLTLEDGTNIGQRAVELGDIDMVRMLLRVHPPLLVSDFTGSLKLAIELKKFDIAFELLKDSKVDPSKIKPYITQEDIPLQVHNQLENRSDWVKPGELEKLLGDIWGQDSDHFKELVKKYEEKYNPEHEPFPSGVIFHSILNMSKPPNEDEDKFLNKKIIFLELAYGSHLFKLNEEILNSLLNTILVQSRHSFSKKLREDLKKIKEKKLIEEQKRKKMEEEKRKTEEEVKEIVIKMEEERKKMEEEERKTEEELKDIIIKMEEKRKKMKERKKMEDGRKKD